LRGIAVGPTNAAFVAGAQGQMITSTNAIQRAVASSPTANDYAGYLVVFDSESGQLPVVNVVANDPNASQSGDPGQFTVQRNGAPAAALTVRYSLSGTASNGVDYVALTNFVTIAGLSSNATITVSPLVNLGATTNQTVQLTLVPDNTYLTGALASATVTIAPSLTTYETWRATKFTAGEQLDANISGQTADPDGDGLKNLLEYALNLEPKAPSAMPGGVPVSDHLTLTYPRRKPPTDIAYRVEVTGSVAGGWTTNGVTEQVTPIDATFDSVKAIDPASIASNLSRFIRLKVSQP
jgi:hypothetical protein